MVGPFGFHPNKTMRSRALGLARPLSTQGYAVQIFMPPWHTPAKADQTWQEDGVSIRYVPLKGGTPGITRQLVHELLTWQPDVVHCFKPKAYSGLVAWWLWQFHRNQFHLVLDSDDWEGWGGWNEMAPYSPIQKRFFAWQEQWGMSHCHTLTVASKALQTLAWGQGIAPEKVVYLPNGAGFSGGSERWIVDSERPTLLLYSRLFEFDVGRLVAVLRGVKTAVPDLKILSVGTGLYADYAEKLRQQWAEAGLLDCVEDVGWVKEAELPALLTQADVGLYFMDDTLLNRTKCPVKLADMVMLGIPVVGEAVGQVPEYVVNGETGLLRPPGDTHGLIQDVVGLLKDAEKRHYFAENAKQHYTNNFSWKHQAELLTQVYRSTE